MVQLGKLKVSPSPQGLADDVLGKKTLSKTAPLSSIKSPLGKDEYPPLSQKEDPFSKTDSLTRKTVRLADPIESISTKIHEPIPPINSEERSSDNGLVLEEKTEVKPILKDSVDKETLEDIPNSLSPSLESQLNFEDPLPNPDIIETPQDPPLHQKNDESHDIPEKDFRPKETANNVDFDQRTSLQYRETLIRQQHCALSIQNVYSNVLTRSSVNDSLHVAILKGDDKLVEEVRNICVILCALDPYAQ